MIYEIFSNCWLVVWYKTSALLQSVTNYWEQQIVQKQSLTTTNSRQLLLIFQFANHLSIDNFPLVPITRSLINSNWKVSWSKIMFSKMFKFKYELCTLQYSKIETTDFHETKNEFSCRCHLSIDGKFVYSIGQVNNTFNFFLIRSA